MSTLNANRKAPTTDLPERKLWCAVIRSAIDARDRRFFHDCDGFFSELCEMLGLPEDQMRLEVLSESQ